MSRTSAAAVKRLAAAPATSLTLIVATAAASLVGFARPQWRVFSSPWFLAAALAGAATLAYSATLQARAARRARRGPPPAPGSRAEAAAAEVLAARGYGLAAVQETPAGRGLLFEKNRLGRWGSAAFHAGLALLILSGLWAHAFRQRGFLQLMEGEGFSGAQDEFLTVEKGPLAGTLRAPFGLRLGHFGERRWDDGALRSYASAVEVLADGRSDWREVSVNAPARVGGFDVYQSPRYGHAVTLELRARDGRLTATHFLLDRGPARGAPERGAADFPGTRYWLRLRLNVDGASPELQALVLESGRVVRRGTLPLGREVRLGRDRLAWVDLRRWSGLIVARRSGVEAAYAGFALCVAGGALMMLLPHRVLRATESDGGWRVAALSRGERALVEEEAAEAQAELARRAAAGTREEASRERSLLV